MPIREGDNEEEFRELLKNPPKPGKEVVHSSTFDEYIANLNDPLKQIKEDERLKKQEEDFEFHCPHCKRASLRRTPQRTYSCYHCGLETNSPLRMKRN